MATKYLGYMMVTQEVGSEGYGGYFDYMICSGNSPMEVVSDYFHKIGREFDPSNIHVKGNGEFWYNDYFATNFIELPGENYYKPSSIHIRQGKDVPKLNIGDTIYLTRSECELRYHGCMFRPEPLGAPDERKIITITITKEGIRYQLSGCGIHIDEDDIGKIAFVSYDDANTVLMKRRC